MALRETPGCSGRSPFSRPGRRDRHAVRLGAWEGTRDHYPRFTRFIPAISPEVSYYPTVAEMCAIVRARHRPGQVLVIVGGNSIFYGSGQPADQM